MNRSNVSAGPRLLPVAAAFTGLLLSATAAAQIPDQYPKPLLHTPQDHPAEHVLILSVDGLHALDLANWIKLHRQSNLAELSRHGVTFSNAHVPWPNQASGLASLVTGGTPISTGIFSSDAYDRALSPPGSNCSTRGTTLSLEEPLSLDKKMAPDEKVAPVSAAPDAHALDPKKMPLDPAHGCTPVPPHSLLRVNTLFEVIHAAGGRTAWADRQPALADMLAGPSGKGLDETYTPSLPASPDRSSAEQSFRSDDLSLQALLAWIGGGSATGAKSQPGAAAVPRLFGMTFHAVSDAQRDPAMGYADGMGTLMPGLEHALAHTDEAVGAIAAELKKQGLADSTWIVVTAPRGQSPIDPGRRRILPRESVAAVVESTQKGLLAHLSTQTGALIWLKDPALTPAVVSAFRTRMKALGIEQILSGEALRLTMNPAETDSRMPDILLEPELGVLWTHSTAPDPKINKTNQAGGLHDEDTHVAMLVSGHQLAGRTDKTWVPTTQLAPLILRILGIEKFALDALHQEHTPALPGIF